MGHSFPCRDVCAKIFVGDAEPTAGVPHWEIWDELPDPLSSFVPELKPRLGGVFLCRIGRRRERQLGGRGAAITRCGRGRPAAGFAACSPRSWWRCLACLPGRAGLDAPGRCRPRSSGPVPGSGGSWPSRGCFAPWHVPCANRSLGPGGPRSDPCDHTVRCGGWRRANGECARLFYLPTFLFCTVCALDEPHCRVPPSPPAIRDMKKPRQRKVAGASDSGGRLRQYLVMSTSFVSGRNRKPTTRLMHATMIGYQRPE